MASSKQRNKFISSIQFEGQTLSSPTDIAGTFSSFFQDLIGTKYPCMSYSSHTLYPQNLDVLTLDDPFTEQEIHRAVMRLADNKASGPDGIPNEFCKLHWTIMKPVLMAIFEELYAGTLQLDKLNFAHIILLPKVLALRLQPFLPSLVSSSQTGFLKGRLISENFIVARELAHHITSNNIPAVLLKLDFFKTFDSVDWDFLFSVLTTRGFPPNFISRIKLSLTTATSAVLVNGMLGPTFSHKRGLRQGDPISPFLFLLAADVLSRMLQATALTLDTTLSHKVTSPFFLLQYADDTLVFSSAEGHTLRALHLTLQLFQNVSGLTVNATKSSFIPSNISDEACNLIVQLFQFQQADFPLHYLGLPLTVARPGRDCFQPLLDKIERKLAGWKGRLLSRSGRLVLVSSVLSSIPSYAMSSFFLPNWLVDAIDKARKRFLWGTDTSGRQKIHLIAWNRICLPKSHGGLGLLDFKLHNRALLLRWIWKLYTCRQSLWFALASNLFSAKRGCNSPALWVNGGSFFWRDLRSLFPLLQLSTRVTVQSGVDTSFWFDNWGGKPLSFLVKGIVRPPKSRLCLKDGLQHAALLLPLPRLLETHSILARAPTVLSPGRKDTIRWRWSSYGRFSVATTYKCWSTARKLGLPLNWIWKLKAPPSLKLFLYLLSNDRLLTRQQLSKRGIQTQGGCAFCDTDFLEDSLHLFFGCPFSAQLRLRLHTLYNTSAVIPSYSTKEVVLFLFKSNTLNDFQLTLLTTSLYALWLERNNRTFRNFSRSVAGLVEWIIVEARSYFNFC
ncbi:hypothetical protein LUZ63_017889 [Rhynchospora breviuscula]|uniref:Reverse transcriptase domain-containing protein n=1 Tax=Rhynchospora breviuscula TaxID=2022672 RepID=A0A9Q0C3C0_9POAL|nr:hypothetical protein LUZ63_017889 [Rhynchospora breviuscula]